jgi:hypothetical protein
VKRGITNRKNLKVAKASNENARWWNILRKCQLQKNVHGSEVQNVGRKVSKVTVSIKKEKPHVLKEENIEFASLEMSFVRWTT